ncbi:RlmE family RNA methyltransferase [Patescibacteria group bacterium]|nr:RlmE family RNA methyltransferase [Patescibacteria group bacterium]
MEEIDKKYKIFDRNVKTVMDIGCSPGSRMQYVNENMKKNSIKNPVIIGLDIKPSTVEIPGVHRYVQDIQDTAAVGKIIGKHGVEKFDAIISDMAPNTIGFKDVDAIRSIELLRTTLPLYAQFLKAGGKAVIKIFMGPGFEEFVKEFKAIVGDKNVKVFKPSACRKESKETYIVKF